MADWNAPVLTTAYATALTNLKDRDVDSGTLFLNAPTNPVTGMIRYNRTTDLFEEYNGSTWITAPLSIAGGGTGAATTADARTNLGIGTIATQNSNAVNITGGTITGLSNLTVSADITVIGNMNGEVQLENNKYIKGKTSGGVSQGLLTLDNNNIVKFGAVGFDIQIQDQITSVVKIGKSGQTGMLVIWGDNCILDFRELDAGIDAKNWRHIIGGEVYKVECANDIISSSTSVYRITRIGQTPTFNFDTNVKFNYIPQMLAGTFHYLDSFFYDTPTTTDNPYLRINIDVSGVAFGRIQCGDNLVYRTLKLQPLGGMTEFRSSGAGEDPIISFGPSGDAGIFGSDLNGGLIGFICNKPTDGAGRSSAILHDSDSGALFDYFEVNLSGTQRLNVTTSLVTVNTELTSREHYPTTTDVYKCGKSGARWSEVWAVNGSIQTSDIRQKNILGTCPGLDFINQIEPVSYNWKHTPGKVRLGIVAQQMQSFASMYDMLRDEEPDNLGFNYTELIAPLIKSVQELYALFQERGKN